MARRCAVFKQTLHMSDVFYLTALGEGPGWCSGAWKIGIHRPGIQVLNKQSVSSPSTRKQIVGILWGASVTAR